jgi:hypothetical protein
MRTSSKTVTFTRPFTLSGMDEAWPAGTYTVETDEELLQALSFPAYRRVATWIRLAAPPGRRGAAGVAQAAEVDPGELEAALASDAAAAEQEGSAAGGEEASYKLPPDASLPPATRSAARMTGGFLAGVRVRLFRRSGTTAV